jgi:hypothetical protein
MLEMKNPDVRSVVFVFLTIERRVEQEPRPLLLFCPLYAAGSLHWYLRKMCACIRNHFPLWSVGSQYPNHSSNFSGVSPVRLISLSMTVSLT